MRRSVVTIGTFDGVHLGHRALVARAREMAGKTPGARVVALAFDPSPLETLRPGSAPGRLTTWAQRERLLREAGADEVVRLEPTRELLAQPAREFVWGIAGRYGVAGVVEGPDFRFGAARAGDVSTLRELGAAMGFEATVVDPVEVVLTDTTVVPARSTVVRWLLANGRVRDAACVLGRAYSMSGTVVRGDRRGRTIGWPTANLESACVAPGDGVYAGRAVVRGVDGCPVVHTAAISVGTKPTFGGTVRAVEATLLGMGVGVEVRTGSGRGEEREEGERGSQSTATARARARVPVDPARWATLDGLPEYGWEMELEFVGWVRDQVKFDGVGPLLEQMARDAVTIERVVREADGGSGVSVAGAPPLLQEARA